MPSRRLSDSEPISEEIFPPGAFARIRKAVVSESSEVESDSDSEGSESEVERNSFLDDEAEECVILFTRFIHFGDFLKVDYFCSGIIAHLTK